MLKNILSAIAGYISIALFLFITFTIMYLLLGAEGSFEAGSYQVSTLWIVLGIIIFFIAAYCGGYISVLIAKNVKAAFILAGVVFFLSLITAILSFSGGSTMSLVREGDVSTFDAMQKAFTPIYIQFLNPFIGAVGVLLGARRFKPAKA